MTNEDALREAKRRWGESGAVNMRPPTIDHGRQGAGRLARYRFLVGNGRLGADCTIAGQGHSWAEAFADARPKLRGRPAR